ncbi:MAG: arsenate reductase (glutaredoxin) [Marinicellaceae bacterium]
MKQIKFYHNPRCSKSRQTLEIIRNQGHEPEVIKYLETPPSIKDIENILFMLELRPRELMRQNEAEYKANFSDSKLNDQDLIALMHEYPKVIERPIVINNNKAIIGRPPEIVLDII